jgi:predicted RNA binding protein YcfA (HicA-like mRNA interferase family)
LNKRKFLARVINNRKNVRYGDFVSLVEAFGYEYVRSNGSHNIYEHKDAPEVLNIQNQNGEAKPYQIKQFLDFVEIYNLRMEG